MSPLVAWFYLVGKQSIDERELTTMDGEALLLMIETANGLHENELAEAIALLNAEYA